MQFLMSAIAAVVCVAAEASAPSFMTNRYFADITVYSPGKKFRLEAKSPDNVGGKPRPFASNFVYTLYDETTKAKVWERKQGTQGGAQDPGRLWPEGEYSPTGVVLTDAGNVVVTTGWNELFSLSAKDGSKLGQAMILEQFTPAERAAYVQETTAGPIWEKWSRWSFLTVKDDTGAPRLLFVVKPYWEHRVVMEVSTGKVIALGEAALGGDVKSNDPWHAKIMEAILADEKEWALKRVQKVVQVSPAPNEWRETRDLYAAIAIVGRRREKDAVPALRILEKDDTITSSSSTGATERGLRQAVHLALRRLGEVPVSEPALSLSETQGEYGFGTGPALVSTVAIKDREGGIAKVQAGISSRAMVDAIGLPDCSAFDKQVGHAFDYDIDASEPFTLRVTIEKNKVTSVKRIAPAVWKDGYERERTMD